MLDVVLFFRISSSNLEIHKKCTKLLNNGILNQSIYESLNQSKMADFYNLG